MPLIIEPKIINIYLIKNKLITHFVHPVLKQKPQNRRYSAKSANPTPWSIYELEQGPSAQVNALRGRARYELY